jgi:CubicO group peptidase (beta-lactamase class C family)
MSDDTIGTVQINSLSTMLNAAIAQATARLGAHLEECPQRVLFEPLGMHDSTWSAGAADQVVAHTKLLGPNETDTLKLPTLAAGTYPFVCTFPGHAAIMNGQLVVE